MDSEVTSIEMKPANQGVTNLGYRSTENGLSDHPDSVQHNSIKFEIEENSDDEVYTGCARVANKIQTGVVGTLSKHGSKIKLLFKLVLLLLYFAYFGYAMYYRFGDEGSIRLLVCTILGVLILLLYTFNRLSGFKFKFSSEQRSLSKEKKIKKNKATHGKVPYAGSVYCPRCIHHL